jgi:hypothetical protein
MQVTVVSAATSAPVFTSAELALAGFAPATVRVGSRFVVEWRLRNLGPAPVAVNVYVRSLGLLVERFACRHARTTSARRHCSASVSLAGGAETRLALLVSAPDEGPMQVRANAVHDGGDTSSALSVEVLPAA